MELDSRKKRRRDRMMRSESVEMQEVREIGQKEAAESSRRSKGDVRRGATARGMMEKSGCVRVIEGEDVRRDDPVKYFLLAVVGSTS